MWEGRVRGAARAARGSEIYARFVISSSSSPRKDNRGEGTYGPYRLPSLSLGTSILPLLLMPTPHLSLALLRRYTHPSSSRALYADRLGAGRGRGAGDGGGGRGEGGADGDAREGGLIRELLRGDGSGRSVACTKVCNSAAPPRAIPPCEKERKRAYVVNSNSDSRRNNTEPSILPRPTRVVHHRRRRGRRELRSRSRGGGGRGRGGERERGDEVVVEGGRRQTHRAWCW